MTKKYRDDVLAAIHETAAALAEVGLMEKETMAKFDALCLTPAPPFTPSQIRALREKQNVSQSVFAKFLNVTTGLVSKWERGEKKPSGPALKLLALAEKNGLSHIA